MRLDRSPILPAVVTALTLACFVAGAHAQAVKPWLPAGSDSLTILSTQAKARFQTSKGDSATGTNYDAFQLNGELARLLLARLGRDHTLQAPAVESVMDSLGLDTDVRVDPAQPSIVFCWIRNPYKPGAESVGYLFWYRRNELRMQGATFPAGRNPRFRAWWFGAQNMPYEAAVLFDRRTDPEEIGLRLFRMGANGAFWTLTQYERELSIGRPGDAVFGDPNGDGRPEVIAWTRTETDSSIVFSSEVPPLMSESIWTERPEGYRVHDVRVLPSTTATLTLFLRQLALGNRDAAAKLLVTPSRIAEAVANGWPLRRQRGSWTVEYGENGDPWPEWLEVKEHSAQVDRKWIFRFVLRDGRWMIQEWIPVKPGPTRDAVPLTPGPGKKK